MDIEETEYEILDGILASGIAIDQIVIEFHHHFVNLGVSRTYEAIEKLNRAGYGIFGI